MVAGQDQDRTQKTVGQVPHSPDSELEKVPSARPPNPTESLLLPNFQVSEPEKGWSPAGVVIARHDQDRLQAKVGQAVHFTFGWTVVPTMIVSHLKVAVNGKEVMEPEMFCPETAPGYCENVYVFRPEKCGEYLVVVTEVYTFGPSVKKRWLVDVVE
jgi:hypothetical protein